MAKYYKYRVKTILLIFLFINFNSPAQNIERIWAINNISKASKVKLSQNDSLFALQCGKKSIVVFNSISGKIVFMKYYSIGNIYDYAITEDPKKLYVQTQYGTMQKSNLETYDLNSYSMMEKYAYDSIRFKTYKISPDSKYFSAMNDNLQIKIWNTDTKELINPLDYSYWGFDYDFSPDSKYLALANIDKIQIVELSEGKLIREMESIADDFTKIKISEDQKYIFESYRDGTIKIFGFDSGEHIQTNQPFTTNPISISYDSTLKRFLVVYPGLYNFPDSSRIYECEIGKPEYNRLISPRFHDAADYIRLDGKSYIFLSDRMPKLLNNESLEIVKIYSDTIRTYNSEFTNNDDEIVFHDDLRHRSSICDAETGTFKKNTQFPVVTFYSKVGKYISWVDSSGVNKWFIVDYKTEIIEEWLSNYFEFSADMKYIAVSDSIRSCILDWKEKNEIIEIDSGANSIMFSPDNNYVFYYLGNNYKILALQNGETIMEDSINLMSSYQFYFYKKSILFLYGELNKISKFNLETKDFDEDIIIPANLSNFIIGMNISDNDKFLIFWDDSANVFISDLDKNEIVFSYKGFNYPITNLTLSHDSKKLLITYQNLTVLAFDISSITTGVKNCNTLIKKLNLSPNPAEDYINIDYNGGAFQKADIILTDISGREIFQYSNLSPCRGINIISHDVSGLPPGAYFVTLRIGDEVMTEKFIKE